MSKADMEWFKKMAEMEVKRLEADVSYIKSTTTVGTAGDPWGAGSTLTIGSGLGGGSLGGMAGGPWPSMPPLATPVISKDMHGALMILPKGAPIPPNVHNTIIIASGMTREEKIKLVAKWLAEQE